MKQEDEADKISFAATLMINGAALEPEILMRSGKGSMRKLVQYRTLASSLERLADFERDLYFYRFRLYEKGAKIKFEDPSAECDFVRYHEKAFKMVEYAFKGPEDKQQEAMLSKVSEKDGIRYREPFIRFEERRAIHNFIMAQESYQIELAKMDERIFELTSEASDIAEARMNVYDMPFPLSERSDIRIGRNVLEHFPNRGRTNLLIVGLIYLGV